MIATTHLAVGAATGLLGVKLAGRFMSSMASTLKQDSIRIGIAFFVATVSHFILDTIPHSDGIYNTKYGVAWVLMFELGIILGIILVLVILHNLNPVIIFAALVGAAWPDVTSFLGWTLTLHESTHSLQRPELVGSLFGQVFIAIVALTLLF